MGDIPDLGQQQLFILNIQPNIVCVECLSNDICQLKKLHNKLTPLTLYVIRYIALMNLFSGVVYPYPGSWLHQPDWVLMAWNMALKQKNKMQLAKNNKGNNKHGN